MRERGFPRAASKKLQMRGAQAGDDWRRALRHVEEGHGAAQQSRWTFDEGANPYGVTRWVSKSSAFASSATLACSHDPATCICEQLFEGTHYV